MTCSSCSQISSFMASLSAWLEAPSAALCIVSSACSHASACHEGINFSAGTDFFPQNTHIYLLAWYSICCCFWCSSCSRTSKCLHSWLLFLLSSHHAYESFQLLFLPCLTLIAFHVIIPHDSTCYSWWGTAHDSAIFNSLNACQCIQ